MECGALGELIHEHGQDGKIYWESWGDETTVYGPAGDFKVAKLAKFYGERGIRMERLALFITTEQTCHE